VYCRYLLGLFLLVKIKGAVLYEAKYERQTNFLNSFSHATRKCIFVASSTPNPCSQNESLRTDHLPYVYREIFTKPISDYHRKHLKGCDLRIEFSFEVGLDDMAWPEPALHRIALSKSTNVQLAEPLFAELIYRRGMENKHWCASKAIPLLSSAAGDTVNFHPTVQYFQRSEEWTTRWITGRREHLGIWHTVCNGTPSCASGNGTWQFVGKTVVHFNVNRVCNVYPVNILTVRLTRPLEAGLYIPRDWKGYLHLAK